jgi:hypothetical protein
MHLAELAKLRSRWGPHGRRRVARRGTLERWDTWDKWDGWDRGPGDRGASGPTTLQPQRGALDCGGGSLDRKVSADLQRLVCATRYRPSHRWPVGCEPRCAGDVLDGDREAFSAYLHVDRTSPSVMVYFERFGISILRPLPSHELSRILHSYWPPSGQKDICSVGRAPRASPFNKH